MSWLGRFGSRARQAWVSLRTNPYVERYEQVRQRNEDPDLEPDDAELEEVAPRSAPIAGPDDGVPRGLKIAAGWSWRMLIVAVGVVAVLYLANMLAIVVVPVLVSLLMAAMLQPLAGLLVRARVPRTVAAAVVLIGGLAVVVGVLTWVIDQFIEGFYDLATSVEQGLGKIQDWAVDGPLHLQQEQINSFIEDLRQGFGTWINDNQSYLAGGALEGINVVFTVLAGILLVLFTTFFFIRDGRRIWAFLVRMLPVNAHEPMTQAGLASWSSLVSFVRATILVAVIDAVGIGAGLVILDVKLAIPLAALVFLGAFIPIVGATVSGAVAVLVALVGNDWFTALLVLGVVLLVQQLEGNVLQPLLMGRAVSIHPLAVVLAVSAGMVLAGPIGGLVAVPVVAVLNTGIKALNAYNRQPEEAPGNVRTGEPPGNVTA